MPVKTIFKLLADPLGKIRTTLNTQTNHFVKYILQDAEQNALVFDIYMYINMTDLPSFVWGK